MEEAKKQRSLAKSQFTRAENAVQSAVGLGKECPAWTLDKRYSELKKRWDNVQDAHDNYVLLLEGDGGAVEPETAWISEIEARFDKLELVVGIHMRGSDIESKARIMSPPELDMSTKAPEPKTIDRKRRPIVKIEPIKFQLFTGDIRKYPIFKEEFKTHIAPLCEKNQEIIVLKSYLSDSVRDEVLSASNDPTDVWKRLDNKYGRSDKIVDQVLNEIKSLPKSDIAGNILNMIKIVERAYRDLDSLGMGSEMKNSSVISDIEGSMSPQMRYEWIKLIASKHLGSVPKFHELMTFLAEWRERLEYDDAAVRSGNNAGSQSFHSCGCGHTYTVGREKRGCWLHKGEFLHPIWNCKEFLAKPVSERVKLTEEHKACKRCLDIGCPGYVSIESCPRWFTCKAQGCGEKHNRLLHLESNTHHASGMLNTPPSEAALPLQVTPAR